MTKKSSESKNAVLQIMPEKGLFYFATCEFFLFFAYFVIFVVDIRMIKSYLFIVITYTFFRCSNAFLSFIFCSTFYPIFAPIQFPFRHNLVVSFLSYVPSPLTIHLSQFPHALEHICPLLSILIYSYVLLMHIHSNDAAIHFSSLNIII